MDNESFDKRIQESLLGYQDQTPAAVGWNKLKLPAAGGGIVGIKKWLWISGIANVILLAVVPYFYHEYHKLNDRVNQLEQLNETADLTAAYPKYIFQTDTVCEYLSVADSPKPIKKTVESKSLSSGGFLIPESWLSAKSYETVSDISPAEALLMNLENDARPGEFHAGLVPAKSTAVATIRKPAGKSINLSTIAELEKNKFGKSVKWEYGLSNQVYHEPNKLFAGNLGVSPGAFVNLWVNPFISIQSGIHANLHYKITKDSTTIQNNWDVYKAIPIPDSKLVEMESRNSALEVPLIFRYHLPVSQKAQWSVGAGATSRFGYSTHQRFTILVPEKEHHEYPEIEFDSFKKEFEVKKWEYLSTSLHAELAYRRRIGVSRLFWSSGMYYEHPLVHSSSIQSDQFGGFLRFSFSQH